MSDEAKVYRNCAEAREAGREIDDATARVIASWYHDGGTSASYSFVSTGAITKDPGKLWAEFTREGTLYISGDERDKMTLLKLAAYLIHRTDRGPVPGWSNLWVE